jgi:hypothetical protein
MTNPTPLIELVPLELGDTIPIADILANLVFQGIITNVTDPNQFMATMDAFQTQAVLTVPVLQGPQGNPGQTAQTLFFQNKDLIETNQLPTDLTNTAADVGKFWLMPVFDDATGELIATTIYVWVGAVSGSGWIQLPVGSPGSPGVYPNITPELNLTAIGNGLGPNDTDSWVTVDTNVAGTPAAPVETFNLAVPPGIQGPSSALGAFQDVDFVTNPPQPGDVFICGPNVTPAAPTALSVVSNSTSGGHLAAGTYYWVVTAIVPNGETLKSNEVTAVTTGATSAVALNWTAPPGGGATGYNVYRGTAPGAENTLVGALINLPATPGSVAVPQFNTGGTNSGNSTSPVTVTKSFNAPLGDDVFVWATVFITGSAGTVTSWVPTYGGAPMTLVGTVNNNNAANSGVLALFRKAGGGTGSALTVSIQAVCSGGATAFMGIAPVSYANVGSIGAVNIATGNSAATAISATGTTGSVILAAHTAVSGTAATTMTGITETQRELLTSSGANHPVLCVADVTETADASDTFNTTLNASTVWSAMAVVLNGVGVAPDFAPTSFTDIGSPTATAAPPTTGIPAGHPIWVPSGNDLIVPLFYTCPQLAFISTFGLSFDAFGLTFETGAPVVCTFALPPQPWPWVPWVFGNMQLSGANIGLSPLLIGATVALGSGQVVATGSSDDTGNVSLMPSTDTLALAWPTSLVPANHTGTQGTLYVTIDNEGLVGVYDFNAANAQLSVLVVPVL